MFKLLLIFIPVLLSGCAVGSLSQDNIALHIQEDIGLDSSKIIKGQHTQYMVITRETKETYFDEGVAALYKDEIFIYDANPLIGGITKFNKRFKVSDIKALAIATAPKGKQPSGKQTQLFVNEEVVVFSMTSSKLTNDEAGTLEFASHLKSMGIKEIESKEAILDARTFEYTHLFLN